MHVAVPELLGSRHAVARLARRLAGDSARATGADSAGVFLRDENRPVFRAVAAYRMPRPIVASFRTHPLSLNDVRGLRRLLDPPYMIFSSDSVPRNLRCRDHLFRDFPMQSVVIGTLRAGHGVVGVLVCAWWSERRRLSRRELRLMQQLLAQAAFAINRARAEGNREHCALHCERDRLATALHDTLSQSLFSVTLKLKWCVEKLPADSPVRSALESVKHDSDVMMTHVREVIRRLVPNTAVHGSLFERLRRLIEQFRELTGVDARFIQNGGMSALTAQEADVVFKMVQEGLANVAKHAQATAVAVRLAVRAQALEMEIVDNGIGLKPSSTIVSAGNAAQFGLRQMFERIHALGGRLTLSPVSPSGLRLRARIPVRRIMEAREEHVDARSGESPRSTGSVRDA